MSRLARRRSFTTAEQGAWIRLRWPKFSVRRTGKTLVAEGLLRPSSVTREYRVRIAYTQGGYPNVFVDVPALTRRPEAAEKPIPHTYESSTPGKERPCLFHHHSAEWSSGMLIAETVIPWLMSWLFDYEVWLLTGHWFGGGVHPVPKLVEDEEA